MPQPPSPSSCAVLSLATELEPHAPRSSPRCPRLMDADRKRLWEKRYYCHAEPSALPMLLASAPSWEWACLPDIYALLKQWSYVNHQDALGLLHATFPDQEVRRTAVQWIDSISDTELLDYLPLVRFLMKRAICDLKITHYFFW
nr:PREDICTED: phosphatidylinositol 4-phosphate 3-kinase C2 domain-containing subunit beta-like [Apteryx mantelli mantelli]